MKKIIPLVMALALVMSLAVPAFAYGPGDEKELAVTAKYNSSTTTGTGVTATLSGGSKTLAAGVENQPAKADSITGTVTISGKPNSNVTANGITVGSVTITISK